MDYRSLTGVEARLLLVYRDNPLTPREEAKELSGIKNDRTFYAARKSLRTLGLLDYKPVALVPTPEPATGRPKEPQQNKVSRILRAYRAELKADLTIPQAQQLLKAAEVDEVIETLRYVGGKKVEKPFPYLLATLRNRKIPVPNVVASKPAAIQEETDDLLPATPEFLASQDRLRSKKYDAWDWMTDGTKH